MIATVSTGLSLVIVDTPMSVSHRMKIRRRHQSLNSYYLNNHYDNESDLFGQTTITFCGNQKQERAKPQILIHQQSAVGFAWSSSRTGRYILLNYEYTARTKERCRTVYQVLVLPCVLRTREGD